MVLMVNWGWCKTEQLSTAGHHLWKLEGHAMLETLAHLEFGIQHKNPSSRGSAVRVVCFFHLYFADAE